MYKKKKQKTKFKLRFELIAIFLVVIAMVGISVVLRLDDQATKLANSYNAAGASLGTDHIYEEVSFEELYEEIKADELTFVVFASPECTTSITEISTINSKATYWDIERVLLVDATKYIIDEEADDYEEDKELTAEIKSIEEKLNANVSTNVFGDAVADVDLQYTPSIWVFENNELVFNSNNFLDSDDDNESWILTWSNIADRAFCINLPNFDDVDSNEE